MAKNNTVLKNAPSYCTLPSEGPILVEIRQFEYTEYTRKSQGNYLYLIMRKIFGLEGYVFHGESLAPQVIQHSCISGKIEVKLVGIQSLPGLMIAFVDLSPAVFSISQQGTVQFCHGHTDLMGSSGEHRVLVILY